MPKTLLERSRNKFFYFFLLNFFAKTTDFSPWMKQESNLVDKIPWAIARGSLLLLILPSFISLLRPGFFSMQDDLQAFRIFEMSKCLKDFQIPCRWIPDGGYGYGYPLFNFYAPSVYYIGSVLNILGFQAIDSVKILFMVGFIISFTSMYQLGEYLFGKIPGVVAATLFTYAPYRAQEVYVRGALSEFWAISILPLPLLFSYKLIEKPNKKSFVLLGLSIFMLLVTHNLIPLIFLPVLFVWVLYWLIYYKKIHSIKPLILSLITGVVLSSFFVLPMISESKLVHVDTILSGYFDYRRHFVSLKQMFFSNVFGYGSSELGTGDDLAIHTGILHWVIALSAVVLSFMKSRKEKKFLGLSCVLGLTTLMYFFLMHLKSSFVWEWIPILKWFQFPWRLTAGSILTTSILGGLFVSQLGKHKILIAYILVGITLLTYGSFFHPKDWFQMDDQKKFSGTLWEKQLTISIFDYLPIFSTMPPNTKAPEKPEIVEGEAEVIKYEKGSNWQKGEFVAQTDSVVRLPIFYFPGMKMVVNEKETKFENDNCEGQEICLGLPTIVIKPGRYEVYVKITNTPIRSLSNLMSIAGFCFLLLITRKKYKISTV